MKQKVFLILGLAVLIVILIGLNAVSYTQQEKQPDSEGNPNRSTYNLGVTGTHALFDLLAETGRNPVRWQETPAELLLKNKTKPTTFVIIGRTRREITDEDANAILKWVAAGGKLVIVDRDPPTNLIKTSADWNVFFNTAFLQPFYGIDAYDQKQMTANIKAAKPIQPTIFTKNINAVQTSAFATSVNFNHLSDEEIEEKKKNSFEKPIVVKTPPKAANNYNSGNSTAGEPEIKVKKTSASTPTPKPVLPPPPSAAKTAEKDETSVAPVIHLNTADRNILVDVPYGAGQIVFLSDPYIVANGGINLVDNAQLAINIVSSQGGIIAFDEYHQGYGRNNNPLFSFFAGTPVIPIFLQLALLVGLVFFSQSRRFARAVPEPEPDRLSKLEYVSAMAELQQLTKGYDLAIENIYTDFRRRVSRLVGVDALKTRKQDLAMLIAERLPDENSGELEQTMQRCEDVMHGGKTNKKEVLRLTTRLRELEAKLGLQRRKKSKK